MSNALDTALDGISTDLPSGEGITPDNPGAPATVEGASAASPSQGQGGGEQPPGTEVREKEGAPSSEPEKPADQKPDGAETPIGAEEAARIEAMREAAKPQEGDSSVIKSLREMLSFRLDKLAPSSEAAPQLSDHDRESLELVKGLYGFDVERGAPTTRDFVSRLAEKDINLVGQLMFDVANTPMKDKPQGWTLGHEFLSRIGLDPNRMDDLVKFSRGELSSESMGVETVPAHIPEEYREAYSQLSQVLRTDVDIYLDESNNNPEQRAAALSLLQTKQDALNRRALDQQLAAQSWQTFEAEVTREVDSQLAATYSTLLDSIKQNPAYTTVKVSSDAAIDAMVKDTIISSINALGDDNSVLAARAAESFKQAGVEVDLERVRGLLKQIETDTVIAVRAERRGRVEKRDYSVQIQEANKRRSDNVAKALALGNRYFSEALKRFNKGPAVIEEGKGPTTGGEPVLRGGVPSFRTAEDVAVGRALSPAELDALVINTSKGISGAS